MTDLVICSVSVCDRPVHSRGWCRGHYQRWAKNQSLETPIASRERTWDQDKTCSVPGCDWFGKVFAGLCSAHQRQKLLGQDFQTVRRFKNQEERFWEKVDKSGDCWVWTGCLTSTGYGQFASRLKPEWGRKAHRWAYFMANPESQLDIILDHKCRNRLCVNPDHLRPVTVAENSENMSLDSRNTSGYRGVQWSKSKKAWFARMQKNYVSYTRGPFTTAEEADEAAKKLRLTYMTHNEGDK